MAYSVSASKIAASVLRFPVYNLYYNKIMCRVPTEDAKICQFFSLTEILFLDILTISKR